jgi:hypothetical protein
MSKFIVGLIFLALIISCQEEKIESQYLIEHFTTPTQNIATTKSFDSVNVIITQKIPQIFSNNNIDSVLVKKLDSLDNLSCNNSTKNYIKACLIASMIGNLMPKQLLGSNFGLAKPLSNNRARSFQEVKSLISSSSDSPRAFDCLDMAYIFKVYLLKYLNLNCRIINLENIHTFPVVEIGEKEYIIDPYWLKIQLNAKSLEVLSLEKLDANELILLKNFKSEFSKRYALISDSLINQFVGLDENFNLKLKAYISNKISSKNYSNSCYKKVLEQKWEIAKNESVVLLSLQQQQQFGTEMQSNTFKHLYLGAPCE